LPINNPNADDGLLRIGKLNTGGCLEIPALPGWSFRKLLVKLDAKLANPGFEPASPAI
jgi:hypothetical protein